MGKTALCLISVGCLADRREGGGEQKRGTKVIANAKGRKKRGGGPSHT